MCRQIYAKQYYGLIKYEQPEYVEFKFRKEKCIIFMAKNEEISDLSIQSDYAPTSNTLS